MHVLVIPSWYQSRFNKIRGVFFKDQALAIAFRAKKVGVIAPVLISIKEVFKTNIFSFHSEYIKTSNLHQYIIPILAFPFWNKLNNYLQLFLAKKMIKRYVNDCGIPDIVHLQSSLAGELALWMQKHYKVPFVVTEHWSGFLQKKATSSQLKLARKVFSRSKHNIAVSQYFACQLQNMFREKFKVVPNTVEVDFFEKGSEKFNHFTFLQVANFDDNKNQKMLIKSFSRFDQSHEVRLKIIGGGEKRIKNNLKSLIKSTGLNERIDLCGVADRNEVKEMMQKSHCLVISSHIETFGVVAIEAMSCGIPVVSTRCGGPEDVVNSKNGILCAINEESLFDSMKEAYYKSWESDTIRNYTLANFSRERYADRMLDLMS